MTNPSILRDTKVRTSEFLLSEANGERSRDIGVLAPHVAAIQAGTVLGKVTATSKLVPYSNAAADGSQTAVAILHAYQPISTIDTKVTIFARDCEVDALFLTGADAPALVELAAAGIIVRS